MGSNKKLGTERAFKLQLVEIRVVVPIMGVMKTAKINVDLNCCGLLVSEHTLGTINKTAGSTACLIDYLSIELDNT